ncbi:hypothetical protein EXS62_02795, partial [Candidatus Kaiserbacteria bacterium]|nr:hypothetical protein [Candidatus Kaiserbacteria bacterium]
MGTDTDPLVAAETIFCKRSVTPVYTPTPNASIMAVTKAAAIHRVLFIQKEYSIIARYTKGMITRYAQRNLVWVDLVAPSAAEVRAVMQEFSLDPVIAEELTSPSPRSKVERRGENLYLVLHFPALRAHHARPEQEIDFVVGKHF